MNSQKIVVIREWVVMASALAVPLLVAWIGLREQRITADQSVKKDYVQMAVTILQQPGTDPALKQWGADVLTKYAPVPLPSGLKAKLESGALHLPTQAVPDPPTGVDMKITPQ
jgi:hypothetical protein